MRTRKTIRLSALVITVLVLLAGSVFARQPRVPMPFDWSLMPASLPAAPGPFDLQFSLSATDYCRDCKEAIITVTTKGSLVYSGPLTWTVPLSEEVPYTTGLPVVLPPNDTGSIHLRVQSGRFVRNVRRWFVSTREIVTVMVGDPRTASRRGPSYSEQRRALMTPEQLAQEVDVEIDLHDVWSKKLELILPLLGTLTSTERDSVFQVRISRETIWKLFDWGVRYKVLDDPGPPPQPDSSRTPRSKTDSLEQQGVLDSLRNLRGDGAFWLDGAYPLTAEGKLPVGEYVTLYLHMLNNTNTIIKGITNGFRVYSPDGATWSSAVGQNCSRLIF